MSAALIVHHAGPACTIQDAGRHGWLRYGVTPAGPMDWRAHRLVNRLAGNPTAGAVIEIGPGGIDLGVTGPAIRLAIVAPRFTLHRDATPLPDCAALTLAAGQRLRIAPGRGSVWGYVAVQGGFDMAPVMGSLATHLRSGIGPLGGAALQAGSRIALTDAGIADTDATVTVTLPQDDAVIRFVPGPQDDYFAPAAMALLTSQPWRIAARSDRMGYRLDGPRIPHLRGHDIVSDGIALGAIQVPGDGQPIVLMADRQPTGGYPKIGTVIRADLPKLAQSPTGRQLQFRAVDRDAAVAALIDAIALTDLAHRIALQHAGPARQRSRTEAPVTADIALTYKRAARFSASDTDVPTASPGIEGRFKA
jgi:biotin-dependent carboxylase-like uncharacterized protein